MDAAQGLDDMLTWVDRHTFLLGFIAGFALATIAWWL